MYERFLYGRQSIFSGISLSFILFLVLTFAAMLFYPGGTIVDTSTEGYSFFQNFFSDLGLTTTYAGYPNLISAVLFFIALTLAGCGLIGFFLAFRQFFLESPLERWLSGFGSCFGVLTGICFIGVALSPVNLYLDIHLQFVFWAFRAFPLAVICYAITIFRSHLYPRRYGFVFVAFGILLVLYGILIEIGPEPWTSKGITIQATGQKIIVYATIITVLIQTSGAKQMLKKARF